MARMPSAITGKGRGPRARDSSRPPELPAAGPAKVAGACSGRCPAMPPLGLVMAPRPYILVVNGRKVRQPVFIIGAPHSGADLLARALKRSNGFHFTDRKSKRLNSS